MPRKSYAEKLKDPRWQKRRTQILTRDQWSCVSCQNDKETLHVHHKRYRGEPWEALDEDLETLCETCHAAETCKLSTAELAELCQAELATLFETRPIKKVPFVMLDWLRKLNQLAATKRRISWSDPYFT